MSARYAIYFAPARDSAWWAFGAHWLGRDEHDNAALAQPTLTGLSAVELQLLTEEPRRYGFHATLKAPFRLADGIDESALIKRQHALAQSLRAVPLGPLRVACLGNFVALLPVHTPPELQGLAQACVTELDDLRAPMLASELLRRRKQDLDARAVELLERYGYPHVLERFRLHLTLTGPLEPALAERVCAALDAKIAALNVAQPLVLDRLCLFVEKNPGAPMQRIIDLKLQA